MQSFERFVTELPQPAPASHDPHIFPRYAVMEAGGTHPRPEIIATGDNLLELCQFYGVDPRLARLQAPVTTGEGND